MSGEPPTCGQPLTPLEYETVWLQAQGFTLPDIALRRGRAVQTVKNHSQNVHAKLGVNSTVDAFRVLGWLHVPEAGARSRTKTSPETCLGQGESAAAATAPASRTKEGEQT